MLRRLLLIALLTLPAGCAAQPAPPPAASNTPTTAARAADPLDRAGAATLTLERIMADPDWIGNAPERPYWSDDGASIFFSVKRAGSDARDLMQVPAQGGSPRVVPDEEKGRVDSSSGDWSADYTRKVYTRAGDIFLKDVQSGRLTQLTRTAQPEINPRFMTGDQRITFRRGEALLIRDLATGEEFQPAEVLPSDDPAKKKDDDDFLKGQQERLFDFVRERKHEEDEARARERAERAADPTRVPPPWYMGEGVEIRETSLSPSGRWMFVRTAKKGAREGKRDAMPQYVADSGYVESRAVRSKVGTEKPVGDSLHLLDLDKREKKDLDLSVLPGISDDPLQDLREAADKRAREKKEAAKDKAGDARSTPTRGDQSKEEPSPAKDGQPDDPAAPATETPKGEKTPEKPKPRPISVRDTEWSEDGTRLVIHAFSLDNKDRWIVAVDLDAGTLIPLERDTDEAWINGRFTALGWLKDNATIWFLSERTGYSHLYLRATDEPATSPETAASNGSSLVAHRSSLRALTTGRFEIDDVTLTRDGRFFYCTANANHPGEHETWRIDAATGAMQQLTALHSRADYALSPDETQLLLTVSSPTNPPDLYIQPAAPGENPRRLTTTVSEAFTSIPWITPEVVEVPGPAGPIYARLYLPGTGESALTPSPSHRLIEDPPGRTVSPSQPRRPAVLFIHGAGYLQNAHKGWSRYFREFMFHNLLAQRGYVVLDMDFRASSGYGRDWRTAIYRNMGTPELDDLEAGVRWLVEHHNVDPARVGCYGGSYGGFLTLMALFTRPHLFACGAALRPVTDWAHYNDGYTSNILNTPEVDPEAYERSSPIEFAAGLTKPLLICHGMQDDNVFFQDTVRLAQRLIELQKQDWEVAMYPIEPHAFTEPASWLDEYRRVLKLFETHLHRPAESP